MALDLRVEEAIREAVAECHQPEALASRITAWLEFLADEASEEDRDGVLRHLELLYDTTQVTVEDEETDGGY